MRSMTGYGRQTVGQDEREMTLEIKCVNHRFLDLSFRLPRTLGFLEAPLREQLKRSLWRGHVDVSVTYRSLREDSVRVTPDIARARAYKRALRQMERETGLKNDVKLSHLLAQEQLFCPSDAPEDEGVLRDMLQSLAARVLAEVVSAREREGEKLAGDLLQLADQLYQLMEKLRERVPLFCAAWRDKLSQRLSDAVIEPVEPQRLAQEVALLFDRAAIDEEISRLSAHIEHLRTLAQANGECGKQLDFLAQEMNREANTIASKSMDLGVTQLALQAKNTIEKMREQIQNVE